MRNSQFASEIPPKLDKVNPSEVHLTSSGGEKTSSETSSEVNIIETSSGTSSEGSPERETPAKNSGDEEITEESVASLRDVVQEEEETPAEKPLPRLKKEIPGYLYNEGTGQYDAAWMYAVDGIQDVKTLMEKTGLTNSAIYNVRSAVRAVIDEVVGKKEKKVNPSEVPSEKGKVDDIKVGQVRSSDTKGVLGGVLVAGDIDASIYEKKPHLPTSSPPQTSSTSPNLTTSSGTSSETSPGTSPE